MSNLRRSRERREGRTDVRKNPVGGLDVVLRDVFPNLVEIGERIRMEGVPAHPPDRRRWLFWRSFLNASSPSPSFIRPLLSASYLLSTVLRSDACSSRHPARAGSTMVAG